MTFGSASVDQPAPAVAASTDDSFAVAWTDFEGDGDELGIRLTRVIPSAMAQPAAAFANQQHAFSQRAPDIVFDGSKFVVAWIDDSDASNGPDIRYRTFDPELKPLSDELTLTATAAVEDHVVLAAFNGSWAAAWRSSNGALETLEVQSGGTHWSVGPYRAGAADDLPALQFIDATHLALAFTRIDADAVDPNTPRLHAAILEQSLPGNVVSFALAPQIAPYSIDTSLSQTKPSVLAFADRLFVSWRSQAVPGSALGEELWRREIRWALDGAGALQVDASALETPFVAANLRDGDQSAPALLSSPFWPEYRTFSVWEDWGMGFGTSSGVRDVGVQVTNVPRPSCSASSISLSPSGSVVASTSIAISAASTCPAGTTASYRFAYAPVNTTTYTYLGGWGSSSTTTWNTTGVAAGVYDVVAFVRAGTTPDSYEDLKKQTVTLTVSPLCSVSSVGSTPNGPVLEAMSVNLSAVGSCPGGATPNYRFAYAPANTTSYTYLAGWGASASATWSADVPQGDYDLVAFIRPSTSTGPADGSNRKTIGVRSKCTAGTLTTSPTTGGSVVSLIGGATCSDPQFSYFYAPDDNPTAWTPIGSAWVGGSVNLNASSITPGTYVLKMDARELSFGTGDTTASLHRQVGPGCFGMSGPGEGGGHPVPLGEPAYVYVEATCDPGVTPEYAFFYEFPGTTTWMQFPGTGWQTNPTGTLDTSGFVGSGQGYLEYGVRVIVRGVGHVGLGEFTSDGTVLIED